MDHSNLHPGSAPHSNRPSAGTQVPAPAPKEDTLDHLGSTIHEQAPGNVYQGGSVSSGGMKTVPRVPRDCGPRPPGRDIPQHQKEPPSGYQYGHPPPGREQPPHRYKSPPLSCVTQRDMANFHHITPTMEKATMSQRLGPSPLHQAPGSYHGSRSCPSSGYPALSETHYHPSQVPSSAQRSVTEYTHSGGRNTGPYNPPGPAPTHNLVYPPGHNVSAGYSGPPGQGDQHPSVSRPHTVNTLNPHDPRSPYAIPQMSSSHLPPPQYPPVDPPITPLSQTVNPPNPPSAHPVKGNNNGVGFQSRYLPPYHSQFTANNTRVGLQSGYLPPPFPVHCKQCPTSPTMYHSESGSFPIQGY